MLTSGAFGYLADYLLLWMLYFSLLIHTWCFFRFFPKARHKWTGVLAGNALVFSCLLGPVAIAGESYLRFACVETDSFGVSLPARRWFALHTNLNSLGCRDREWSREKPPGVRRIAFVGDSFTYGWGIERPEDRFPDLIQARFDRRAPRTVEVMNVAKAGWDSGDQIQPIKDMIDIYGVDEVVLCYVANDIEKLLPTRDGFNPTRPPEPSFFNIDSSCLLDYLYRRIIVPRVASVSGYHDWLAEGYAEQTTWREHQRRLGTIIRHCEKTGVVFRVALLPFIRTGGEKFQTAKLHSTLARFFEANNVPVVDLAPTIVGRPAAELVVNRGDAHPNEFAQTLFADRIWSAFYAPLEQ